MKLLAYVVLTALGVIAAPTTNNKEMDITYKGFSRNGVEVFLGIPYAQDTGGQNRFRPPQPLDLAPGSVIDATKPGYACPQQLGQWNAPLTLLNVTEGSISENCLNLNIVRPANSSYKASSYPVMVWIHGGEW